MMDHHARECTLRSKRMVDVLVKFNNVVIKLNHHPERWLKVARVMIEKRKAQE